MSSGLVGRRSEQQIRLSCTVGLAPRQIASLYCSIIRYFSCQTKFARDTNDIQAPPIFSQFACKGLKQKLGSGPASPKTGPWGRILAAPHVIATQHSCSIMPLPDSAGVAELHFSEFPSRARNETYPGNLPKKLARVKHDDTPHDRLWAHRIPKFPKEEGSHHCTMV